MRTFHLFCSALALATGLALPAAAATLTVSAQNTSNIFSTTGSTGVTITESTLRPDGIRVLAGGFAVTGDLDGIGGVESFTAWCLDIATALKLPSTYDTTATPFASGSLASKIGIIERLFETGFKAVSLAITTKSNGYQAQSAGFQLALWEVLYENDTVFSLAMGNFKATKSAAAIAAAEGLLTGVVNGHVTQSYDLTFLESNDSDGGADGHYSQHLVTVSAVPLPAGGILLLTGLGGLGLLRRRLTRTTA